MRINKTPYREYSYFKSIDQIIKIFPYCELETTNILFKDFSAQKGKLSQKMLSQICAFKTRRSKNLVKRNSQKEINNVVNRVRKTKNDREKIEILKELSGVEIPTASTILMFFDQRKYPIIDTRVWQVLWDFGKVKANKSGKSFTLNNWEEYLKIIGQYAIKYGKSARHIEKVLYSIHALIYPVNR